MNSKKKKVYENLNEITNPALALYIYFASDVIFSYNYTYLALLASRFKTDKSRIDVFLENKGSPSCFLLEIVSVSLKFPLLDS